MTTSGTNSRRAWTMPSRVSTRRNVQTISARRTSRSARAASCGLSSIMRIRTVAGIALLRAERGGLVAGSTVARQDLMGSPPADGRGDRQSATWGGGWAEDRAVLRHRGAPVRHRASQSEVERRSPIDHALGPDAATVPGDDAPYRRESHAGALEFGRGMQALEHAEQLVRVLHVEAGPVVPDQERALAVRCDRAEFHPALRLFCGVLPAVAKQILERHPQQARIAPRLEPLSDREFHPTRRPRALQVARNVAPQPTPL